MMFGRPRHQRDEKPLDPVLDERSDSIETKLSAERTPTTAGPHPVSRHLLHKLQKYPRLRDVVVGYLLVQDRIVKYEAIVDEIRDDLPKAGESSKKAFWDGIHKKLGAEGLRADFPNRLLADPQFEDCVRAFDEEHAKARAAAAARSNPFQSAEAADEVTYAAVRAILNAAEDIAVRSKAEARSLLDELQEAVNGIFADEQLLPMPVGATVRTGDPSPVAAPDAVEPTRRGTADKQLEGGASATDLETQPTAARGAK